MIENIAKCFACGGRLQVPLAKPAKGYYIEARNLLTIVTPTGLPEKPPFDNDDSNKYAIFHRTDWEVVAKILVDDVIRPVGWSRNADNIPNQYSCFGFFGYCSEPATSSTLTERAVNICNYRTLQDRQGPTSSRFDSNLSYTKAQQAHGRGQ